MNVYNPTQLRNHLFNSLETVQKGEMVCTKIRKENLYIISEKLLEKLTHFSNNILGENKLREKILQKPENNFLMRLNLKDESDIMFIDLAFSSRANFLILSNVKFFNNSPSIPYFN